MPNGVPGSNDGNSINPKGSNKKKTKDVNIKISADTKEAIRSIRDLERQVNKLGDLADQGQRRQGGFLSPKQVDMYKKILKDIEQTYKQHQDNMKKLDDQYNQTKSSPEAQKMKTLKDNLATRQKNLANAQGGNRWGDQANPVIQEYHRTKLEEAQKEYNSYRNSDEYKNHRQSLKEQQVNRSSMQQAVDQIAEERSRAQTHANRIDNLYERNPNANHYVHGTAHLIAHTGAVTGLRSYIGYTDQGVDVLRQQERLSNGVTLGLSTGGYRADALQRDAIAPLGEKANYSAGETAALQQVLMTGGYSNINKLNQDTQSVQQFSRAYNLDPNQVASSASTLQKMGTFSQGEQQKFAEMLATAISKEGMSGRQAEVMQSVMTLAQNVSSGQAQFTQQQFANTMGLQIALGQSVPTLKGNAGAQVLSNMDAAIKGGGQNLDLLMGKGTKYTGLQGMYQLQLQQEQGLSNPKNLQDVLQGAQRMFGDPNSSKNAHDMTGLALKENLNLPLNEYEALSKSGFLDKIMKDPQSVTAGELQKAGATTLSKQWNQYQNSQTARIDSNQARGTNVQARNAKAANEAATSTKSAFYGMGDYADIAAITAGGIGIPLAMRWAGGKIPRAIANGANRMLSSRIGGNSGSWMDRLLNRAPGAVRTAGVDALEGMSTLAKATPLIGGVADVAINRMTNPKESWGRSLSKGIGSAVGTGLGILASGAIDVGTGGLGAVTNVGLTAGGAYVGDKVGNWLYSLFNGNGDQTSVPSSNSPSTPPPANSTNPASASSPAPSASAPANPVPTQDTIAKSQVSNMTVNKLNINDKSLASVVSGSNSGSSDGSSNSNGSTPTNNERVIRIIFEGNITGMNNQNQTDVKNSLVSYLNSGGLSNLFQYNLSFDQSRG